MQKNKSQELILLQRKSSKGQYSIESINLVLQNIFKQELNSIIYTVSKPANGLINKLIILKECLKLKSDIIHVTGDIYFSVLGILNPKNKVVITYHDVLFLTRSKGFKKLLFKLFWIIIPYKIAEKIIFISQETADQFNSIYPTDEAKVTIIPNPLTIDKKYISSAPLQMKNSFGLIIGTKANKNVTRMVESILENPTLDAMVLGPTTIELKELQLKFGSRLIHEESVSTEKLYSLYKSASFLCFCSLDEGFGLPILEAQFFSCPVITSNISSMPYVCGSGGVLVDPYSKKEIIAAIAHILKTKNRSSFINKGKENILRFEPQTIAEKYLNVYKNMK